MKALRAHGRVLTVDELEAVYSARMRAAAAIGGGPVLHAVIRQG